MDRLLALRLDDAVFAALESRATEWGLRVQCTTSPELLKALGPDARDASGVVQGIALGDVDQPLRTVHRVRASVPGTPIVLVRSKEECASLREALRFSPFGTSDVDCVPDRPPEQAVDAIRFAVERGAKKRRLQQTLDGLNRKIADSARERRLGAAAGMLSRLMDVAPTGVVVTRADGVVQDVNLRAVQLLGHPETRLLGTPAWAAFARDDQSRMRGFLAGLDEDSTSPAQAVFRCQDDDGARYLEVSGARLDPASGGPGYIVILQDVTERVGLVEELRASNRRKDEFLAMLSHELRNPLAPIRTATELLRMREEPAIERELSIIERHVGHLVDLVDDLLDVARITRGDLRLRRERVDVASFVTQAIEMATPLLEARRHELTLSTPTAPLEVEGDPRRLAQIVTNLLTNAAKHTEPGGTIALDAAREGHEARIRVQDRGKGIEPELLPHIFEMFVQERQELDRASGGLGLGLAIVRGLVHAHGGTVEVDSELGRGSTFTVRLPLMTTDAAERAEGPASTPPGQEAGGELVLIVDDNEDAAVFLAHLVRPMGYRTEVAHDAPAALALVERIRPDVALLDIGLPVVDGYELAQRLRRIEGLEGLPLIAVTGYGQSSDRSRSRAAGFSAHLVKPVSKSQLSEAIADALLTRPASEDT